MHLAITNANIITLDANIPRASAILILNGTIAAIGDDSIIESVAIPNLVHIDASGKTIVPGFVESHTHPLMTGIRMNSGINCGTPPSRTIADLVTLMGEFAESKNSEVIQGHSYDDSLIQDNRHLTRFDLDEVSTTRPVIVTHISGHLAYGNSMALKMAGVSSDSPDPDGGVIDRTEYGDPTGVFYESATRLILRLAGSPDVNECIAGLEWAGKRLVQTGVTTIHDVGSGHHETSFRAYDLAGKSDKFPIRTYLAASYGGLAGRYGELDAVPTLARTGLTTGFGSEQLKAGILKIVHDGSLQGHSGALTEGYHDHQTETGIQIWSQDTLNEVTEQALLAGWQVGTHGNGDRAIDSILDAYERALDRHPTQDHRFRIEHCQTVREDQLDRMAELNVAASFFNLHVYYWGDRHRDRFLGPNRGERISPLKGALDRGILFGCHSDWWVTPVDPLFNVHVAVNRQTRGGEKLGPEFVIDPEAALRSMTLDAAALGFEEKIKGSLSVGKLGDLVVLSDDPLAINPANIDEIEVEQTVINGKIVYDRAVEGGSRKDERNSRNPDLETSFISH